MTCSGFQCPCPRTVSAWLSALSATTAPAPTQATCACTPRAAERGPRWALTSTAKLRATCSGTRYPCPRTVRAWRSALSATTAPAPTQATCACTPRAAERGPRWALTSTAKLRATCSGTRYPCPRTVRAWRSALLATTAPAPTQATCACTPRAVGRGPRWALTSTARLRTTI